MKQTDTQIVEKLQQIVLPYLTHKKDIAFNDNLKSDLGFDSIDMVDIVIMIEDTFSIKFQDSEWNTFNTVTDLVQLIAIKINGAY